MVENKKIKIGCASAFWGDTNDAAAQLVNSKQLNYLVFDYLAEVTMSILAASQMKNPDLGYATDFISQTGPLLSEIKEQGIKVISNAGGINPIACREALIREADKQGLSFKIAIVEGDNLFHQKNNFLANRVQDIDTAVDMPKSVTSINAYLGAEPIRRALDEGADIIITGRCVDSAVTLGPLMFEFGWKSTDYDLLAAGSLAGHIIECGAQCNGGNFTDWHLVQDFDNIGFPIIEVVSNGDFTVFKPENTGGLVSFGTVAEQFLYEIGDPGSYILPDVVCDFRNVTIKEIEKDKVLVSGAKGKPPTKTYKVSATYLNGYRTQASVIIGGINAPQKAKITADAILKKTSRMLKDRGMQDFSDKKVSIIGTEAMYGDNSQELSPREILLRIIATHPQKEALILLSREIAQGSTGMTPGFANMLGGRPSVSPSIKLFSFLTLKKDVKMSIEIDNKNIEVLIDDNGSDNFQHTNEIVHSPLNNTTFTKEVPLYELAFARSGDKGDHSNIGVISRKPEYFSFIKNHLTHQVVKNYFSHVAKGDVQCWEVPGVCGLNFLLKHSLGGGGMASLNIDPQGKAYAQQLLDIMVPIPEEIYNELLKKG
mgnify:FL=1